MQSSPTASLGRSVPKSDTETHLARIHSNSGLSFHTAQEMYELQLAFILQVHVMIEHCLLKGLDALQTEYALISQGVPRCMTRIGLSYPRTLCHCITHDIRDCSVILTPFKIISSVIAAGLSMLLDIVRSAMMICNCST